MAALHSKRSSSSNDCYKTLINLVFKCSRICKKKKMDFAVLKICIQLMLSKK